MALNRYKLRHLARKGLPNAKRVFKLVKRPDHLLGTVLIGNTFANIFASALATVLATHHWGEAGIAIATISLTLFVLIFAEVIPKTLAAANPERMAYPASLPLSVILIILKPLIALINLIANAFLKPFGLNTFNPEQDELTSEELKSVVNEQSSQLGEDNKDMLLGVLDLETITIADVMIPRHQVTAIDISQPWDAVRHMIIETPFSKIPVYEHELDNITGILHLRSALQLISNPEADMEMLKSILVDPNYIPESTSLQRQLVQFQKNGEHLGIVVDEYGDIQGIVTMEDILEEIVGEITHDKHLGHSPQFYSLKNGTYVVSGSMTIRDINRQMDLDLPVDGPKTLGGLITEHLEAIPSTKMTIMINHHPIEIISVRDNAVDKARISPKVKGGL